MKKIYLVFLLSISACTIKPSEISILEDSTCNLPCWNNIIVGETTKEEVLEFIENSTDVDQESLQITDHSSDLFDTKIFFSFQQSWIISQSPSHIRFEFYFIDDIVGEIMICGKLNTAIYNIVNEIGEPEKIISGNNLVGSRTVILINPQEGISYTYDTDNLPEKLKYEISQDIQINCLNLFDPTLFTELMDIGVFSGGHYNSEETLRVMYQWNGFGNLDEKYPPRQP